MRAEPKKKGKVCISKVHCEIWRPNLLDPYACSDRVPSLLDWHVDEVQKEVNTVVSAGALCFIKQIGNHSVHCIPRLAV
jgi:hypothetical protein